MLLNLYYCNTRKMKVGLHFFLIVLISYNFRTQVSSDLDQNVDSNRVVHTIELMSTQPNNELPVNMLSETDIEKFITGYLKKSLPKKYKGQADSISKAFINEAAENKLDPMFLLAVARTESALNPEARGMHREIGLLQLKPDTAEWLARETNTPWSGYKTLRDPALNIRLGAKYFSFLREKFGGQSLYYISAYNMGWGRINSFKKTGKKPVIYNSKVMKKYIEQYTKILAQNKLTVASM
jgi:soluble lytic murein transglycosylase